jgi:RNA polymerase sigma-70 factor (ECF subfamily)
MIDWHAIVTEHGPTVWRTAYRILADHADALDSYQETFLSAYRSPPRVPVRDWGAYLITLAARRAIDRLRQRGRERARIVPLGPDPLPPAGGPGPAEQAAAGELMDRVRRALAGLPARQAEAFWLCCVEGLSNDQTAAHLGVSPGAARVLVHRARAALAAALAPAPVTERSKP